MKREFRKKKGLIISIFIFTFLILWFLDFLPQQVVKIVAKGYISQQENGDRYKLKNVEYSPAHDCYFAYFYEKENPDGETRNIGVYYRYIPISIYFDSAYLG